MDRVCSEVQLVGLAIKQPPPGILKSGTGLSVH
jgi:hypothetical protein